MAMSLSGRASVDQPLRLVVLRRYCRLMLPYMAAIGVALLACHWGRAWLPEEVVGEPPHAMQVVAHLFLLHDILGYESLAAGVWFLCIDFQLALLYIAIVYLARAVPRWRGRDLTLPQTQRFSTDLSLGLGWALALASVFYFNVIPEWDPWAIYFFAHFFTGVMVYQALAQPRYRPLLAAYLLMLGAGLAYDWRGHLAISLVTGSVLYLAGRAGWLERWPDHPLVRFQARTSYSLFLLHFPVLIVIAAVWERYDWDWRGSTALALVLAYLASVLAAAAFYRTVEAPAARLARRFG
jgi:peptidoglycan/LPS O-acetylase OafA/YrhL